MLLILPAVNLDNVNVAKSATPQNGVIRQQLKLATAL